MRTIAELYICIYSVTTSSFIGEIYRSQNQRFRRSIERYRRYIELRKITNCTQRSNYEFQ